MRSPQHPPRRNGRALAFAERFYRLALRLYPAGFRQRYGLRMARVFHDSCRDTLAQRGLPGLFAVLLHTLADLLATAPAERWRALTEVEIMANAANLSRIPLRLWVALVATGLAFVVTLLASINLYLLEDGSSLTNAAYAASPLLRFSYDAVYLTALAAAVAICASGGYILTQEELAVNVGIGAVALVVALGGFGGLLVRYPQTFAVFAVSFAGLIALSLWLGRVVRRRSARRLGPRPAAVLGACSGAGVLLLLNVVALVLHTIALNPVSHDLYMQGQIAGTHLNFTLIVMGLAALALGLCALCLGLAYRGPAANPGS